MLPRSALKDVSSVREEQKGIILSTPSSTACLTTKSRFLFLRIPQYNVRCASRLSAFLSARRRIVTESRDMSVISAVISLPSPVHTMALNPFFIRRTRAICSASPPLTVIVPSSATSVGATKNLLSSITPSRARKRASPRAQPEREQRSRKPRTPTSPRRRARL